MKFMAWEGIKSSSTGHFLKRKGNFSLSLFPSHTACDRCCASIHVLLDFCFFARMSLTYRVFARMSLTYRALRAVTSIHEF